MNESARTKGEWVMGILRVQWWVNIGAYDIVWENRWWSIIKGNHVIKERDTYLTNDPVTEYDQFNGNSGAGRVSWWRSRWRAMEWWWHDQLVTMELVLSWYKVQHRVSLVVQSLPFSTTKHPHNNRLLFTQTCPCLTVAPSSLRVVSTPLPGQLQGGLEGTTHLDNR